MQFELTGAVIDEILFSMEDQDYHFLLDTIEGEVVGGPDFDPGALEHNSEARRYIDLPEWDSSDGFRLMERFTAGFKNPLIREELSAALDRGRGVFRAFKDVLGRHPEAEKLWFSYKEREMKRKIVSWYNVLREEWGLEKIGNEPEETDDLVLEDFRFRSFQNKDKPAAFELHAVCEKENPAVKEYHNRFLKAADIPGTHAWVAESGSGEFAGFLSAELKDGNFYIEYLEVKPEYRGLGIGESLLARFLENAVSEKAGGTFPVYMELPVNIEGFSRVLARENFSPYMTCYILNPNSGETQH